MAQIKNLIARWDAAWPSPMIISRQYDNCQFRIDLMNYPEPEYIVDEQTEQMEVLSYYLIVWMKETEDGEYREMSPIMLPGPYWIVPNQYTQLVQDIRFQFCVQSDSTEYEAHSAIFTGRIVDSIEHDGTAIDVIPVEMFDAYKAYIQEIAMAAGAVVIDPNLDTTGAAADAKAVGDAIKAGKTFVVQVPGSATVYSGSITAGDFAKALAAYTAGSSVYAVKDSEVYQLSAVSSSTMTFTQMYHGTMNFIKQIQITSADTFTVTNTALSSSAADTSYSNTASGLAATNVQAAIDESAAALSNTNERLLNAFPVDTASGSVVTFDDGADGVPLKSLTVGIDPVQDTSQGDPSPTNICPISGWTGAKAHIRGKNLSKTSIVSMSGTTIIPNKATGTLENDEYVMIPTGTNEDVFWGSLGFAAGAECKLIGNASIKGGSTYTATILDADSNFSGNYVQFMDENGGCILYGNSVYIRFGRTTTFTAPEGAKYVGFRIGSTSLTAGNTYRAKILLELGSVSSAYEPYAGDDVNVIFPTSAGTVYGGTLDVTNGVLTVDMAIVDLGTFNWSKYGDANLPVFYTSTDVSNMKPGTGPVAKCSIYRCSEWTNLNTRIDKSVEIHPALARPYIADSAYTDAATFKSAMSGVQLCYQLASPITYQLDPHEVESLLGANNIYADTGDSTVVYRADPTLYITRKIAEAVSALS